MSYLFNTVHARQTSICLSKLHSHVGVGLRSKGVVYSLPGVIYRKKDKHLRVTHLWAPKPHVSHPLMSRLVATGPQPTSHPMPARARTGRRYVLGWVKAAGLAARLVTIVAPAGDHCDTNTVATVYESATSAGFKTSRTSCI